MNYVDNWDSIKKMSLPSDLVGLPTMVAEPWLQVNEAMPIACMEGSIFDADGNLYYCFRKDGYSTIYKITPDKQISEYYHRENSAMIGIAVHKDGRFFVADAFGRVLELDKDGKFSRDLLADHPEVKLAPNDLAFDMKGNLYFTDFSGTYQEPAGGVYRLDADGDYTQLHLIVGGLAAANGIVITPAGDEIWVTETARNCVLKVRLDKDGFLRKRGGLSTLYYNQGVGLPDSSKMDEAGNLYQTINFGGRIVILDHYGMAVANVVVPEREKADCLFSPNLAIKPGTDEGYLLCSGMRGAWVFKFRTIAKSQKLFADLR